MSEESVGVQLGLRSVELEQRVSAIDEMLGQKRQHLAELAAARRILSDAMRLVEEYRDAYCAADRRARGW